MLMPVLSPYRLPPGLSRDEVALADVAADPADVDRRGFASFGNGANSGTCFDPGMDALQDVLAF